MINQDRKIFSDFSVKTAFLQIMQMLFSIQILTALKISSNCIDTLAYIKS